MPYIYIMEVLPHIVTGHTAHWRTFITIIESPVVKYLVHGSFSRNGARPLPSKNPRSLRQSPHISGSDTSLTDLVKFFIRSASEKFCHLYPKWYYNGTFNMKTNINKILVLSHKIKSTHHSTPILWIYLWSSFCPWPWCGIVASSHNIISYDTAPWQRSFPDHIFTVSN